MRWGGLATTKPVVLGSAISLALGLFFVFVWSPLPFGWLGIDFYHDRAVRLASGQPFDTTDVPWGYAYYVALFYALFGPHPWLPLVGQVVLNAFIPLLLYQLVLPLTDRHTAALAALLTGVFSFNTVYASTLSSDAVCTVLFLAALLLFERARRTGSLLPFALSGLLAGLAPQFRPNLILFSPLLALLYVLTRPRLGRKLLEAAVYLGLAALALTPWVVRNYRLTHTFLPTSTHGGIQLWYGTLQTGPYLQSRAYNPRSLFEPAPFDYTSIEGLPIIVEAQLPQCAPPAARDLRLMYWTDRNSSRVTVGPTTHTHDRFVYEIAGQQAPTTVYYLFESAAMAGGDPFVYFVATDHLGDLDRHDDLVDIFDVIRTLRALAWENGRATEEDARRMIAALLGTVEPGGGGSDGVGAIEAGERAVTVRLKDGSILTVPREWGGRVTDLIVNGDLAGKLLYARGPATLLAPARNDAARGADPCATLERVAVNEVYYRREPHLMRRYTSLALDNIARDPAAFVAASAYRMVRLFIIQGTDDARTAQQFAASGIVYRLAWAASLSYLAAFAVGVFIAFRRRSPVLLLLLPILYVPLTICFVLTNMRYTVTVQPYMFTFVALAIVAALDGWTRSGTTR